MNPVDALSNACISGDLFILETLSHQPHFKELYTHEDLHCEPLWLACRYGHLHIVKWFCEHPLLELVVHINAPSQGTTPLQEACKRGHLPVVEWLYLQVTLFGDVYPNGLHEAVLGQHPHIVEWLVSHQAYINYKAGHEFDTPLHVACRVGSLSLVTLLHSLGAFIDLVNQEGSTPLLIACFYGHLPIVQYLHSYGANIHRENAYNESAVWLACESGNLSLVRWLYDHHVSIHKSDKFGRLPLSRAAYGGHTSILEWLAPLVNVNARDYTGETAMIEACREGHLIAAQRIYHYGGNPHLQDNLLHDPLYYACEWNRPDVVTWLCSFGVTYCPYRIQNASEPILEILFFQGAFYQNSILTFIPPSLRKRLLVHYRQRQFPLQKNIIGFDALLDTLPLCSDISSIIGEYTGILQGKEWTYLLDAI